MVEVMKIMVTSFKRSYVPIAALSAADPAPGHHQSMPLPETPGHSLASLGQSLVGSLLLSPGSWCTQSFVCALLESVSQYCVSSGGSMMGFTVQEDVTYPGLLHRECISYFLLYSKLPQNLVA